MLKEGFDPLNRATQLKDPAGTSQSTYDADGRITSMADVAGTMRTMTYDALARIATMVHTGNSFSLTLHDIYDAAGRKSAQFRDGVETDYTYDAASRLTGQQVGSGFATFAYDGSGNPTLKWHQGSTPLTMTYDPADRITTSIQGAAMTTVTFDPNGNRTLENASGSLTSYMFDNENRMTAMTQPNVKIISNTYSGDGLRRSTQQHGGSVHTMIWDGKDYLGEVQ